MTKTRILIAASSSGSGKTTVAMGLLRALKNRGMRVRPYKCGPDYIDTQWQTLAASCPSINLDTWMMEGEDNQKTFQHYAHGMQVTLTEGAMGLFDGYERWHGSAAEIAALTDAHIVLVVDARAAAFSTAATILGTDMLLQRIGVKNRLAGVIFNQVGSDSHFTYLKDACREVGVRCLGYLPKCKDISLPSRHLGLTLDTRYRVDKLMEKLASLIEEYIDLDALLAACANPNSETGGCPPLPNISDKHMVPGLHIPIQGRIAIARDEAFNFCYERNIDLLKATGRELVFFSPLADRSLPSDTSFVYLPGGYPEFFLPQLSANHSMKQSIHDFAEQGGAVYAECGGMLYLAQYIEDESGQTYPMANVLPLHATFQGMHLHLGYREVSIGKETWKGHEFHYSEIHEDKYIPRLGQQRNARNQLVDTALYTYKHVIAGYTHLTFGSHTSDGF